MLGVPRHHSQTAAAAPALMTARIACGRARAGRSFTAGTARV